MCVATEIVPTKSDASGLTVLLLASVIYNSTLTCLPSFASMTAVKKTEAGLTVGLSTPFFAVTLYWSPQATTLVGRS